MISPNVAESLIEAGDMLTFGRDWQHSSNDTQRRTLRVPNLDDKLKHAGHLVETGNTQAMILP